MNLDTTRAERENLRWLILLALWHARPHGCSEGVLVRTAQDIFIATTADVMRREMDYLQGFGLIEVQHNPNNPMWYGKLTSNGTNVVEYRADPPAGVARPPKW